MGIDMSKELEALEELFGIAAYCNCNLGGMDETQLKKYEEKCENMKKIIEQALKRDEPIKLKTKCVKVSIDDYRIDAYCPTCDEELYTTSNYCPRCGQKLKWNK